MKVTVTAKQAKQKKFVYPCILEHKSSGLIALMFEPGCGTVLSPGSDRFVIGEMYTSFCDLHAPDEWRVFEGKITLESK